MFSSFLNSSKQQNFTNPQNKTCEKKQNLNPLNAKLPLSLSSIFSSHKSILSSRSSKSSSNLNEISKEPFINKKVPLACHYSNSSHSKIVQGDGVLAIMLNKSESKESKDSVQAKIIKEMTEIANEDDNHKTIQKQRKKRIHKEKINDQIAKAQSYQAKKKKKIFIPSSEESDDNENLKINQFFNHEESAENPDEGNQPKFKNKEITSNSENIENSSFFKQEATAYESSNFKNTEDFKLNKELSNIISPSKKHILNEHIAQENYGDDKTICKNDSHYFDSNENISFNDSNHKKENIDLHEKVLLNPTILDAPSKDDAWFQSDDANNEDEKNKTIEKNERILSDDISSKILLVENESKISSLTKFPMEPRYDQSSNETPIEKKLKHFSDKKENYQDLLDGETKPKFYSGYADVKPAIHQFILSKFKDSILRENSKSDKNSHQTESMSVNEKIDDINHVNDDLFDEKPNYNPQNKIFDSLMISPRSPNRTQNAINKLMMITEKMKTQAQSNDYFVEDDDSKSFIPPFFRTNHQNQTQNSNDAIQNDKLKEFENEIFKAGKKHHSSNEKHNFNKVQCAPNSSPKNKKTVSKSNLLNIKKPASTNNQKNQDTKVLSKKNSKTKSPKKKSSSFSKNNDILSDNNDLMNKLPKKNAKTKSKQTSITIFSQKVPLCHMRTRSSDAKVNKNNQDDLSNKSEQSQKLDATTHKNVNTKSRKKRSNKKIAKDMTDVVNQYGNDEAMSFHVKKTKKKKTAKTSKNFGSKVSLDDLTFKPQSISHQE